MKTKHIVLLMLSAFVCVYSMFLNAHRGPEGNFTWTWFLVELSVYPLLFLAGGLILYALFEVIASRYVVVAFVALILSSTPFDLMGLEVFQHKLAAIEESKKQTWLTYGKELNPLIIEYIQSHPEKVTYSNTDDVIKLAGLGDFLRERQKNIPVKGDDIIDPWGDPVLIIMEHSQSGMLIAPATRYGVWSENGNKIAVALFEPNPHSLAVEDNLQWQIQIVPR